MAGNNGFLKIKEADLAELIDFQARSLVGKICKRFEILESKEDIKRESRELIYEEFRQIKELVLAYDRGLHVTTFKFTNNNTRKDHPVE